MTSIEGESHAAEFLCKWISDRPEVASIKLFRARQTPLLTGDQLSPSDAVVFKKAILLKESTSMPFWDAAMLAAMEIPLGSQMLFDRLMLHNSSTSGVVHIERKEIQISHLRSILSTVENNELLVLSSKVSTISGEDAYIPMLDFHLKANDTGLRIVQRVVHAMNLSGSVLESGKSYHFYGDSLLNKEEQRIFLAKALLFGPIIDRAWIAHQLIEGECGLRLSVRTDYGVSPRFIGRVERRLG